MGFYSRLDAELAEQEAWTVEDYYDCYLGTSTAKRTYSTEITTRKEQEQMLREQGWIQDENGLWSNKKKAKEEAERAEKSLKEMSAIANAKRYKSIKPILTKGYERAKIARVWLDSEEQVLAMGKLSEEQFQSFLKKIPNYKN